MALWGRDAIVLDNKPRPDHRINFDLVDLGVSHPNIRRSDQGLAVRLQGGVFSRQVAGMLDASIEGIECLVDTGAGTSYFVCDVARELRLAPCTNVFFRRVGLAVGSCGYFWSEHELALGIGPNMIAVPVRFCVKRVGMGFEWQDKIIRDNILGMKGVLSRRMLCFTPETLFVFAKR